MIPAFEKISVVTPCYNELETICALIERVSKCLEAQNWKFEIIVVDDGSTDGSLDVLKKQLTYTPNLTVASLDRHIGKAEAMQIGFYLASGDVIVTLDSDLQDEPEEIPKLLREIGASDFVIGWRKNRRDRKQKRVISRIANSLIRAIIPHQLNDIGCNLRAFKINTVKNIRLKGGLHRYLALIALHQGFNVTQVAVSHNPRTHGKSKYTTLSRSFATLKDIFWLITLRERYWLKESRPTNFKILKKGE